MESSGIQGRGVGITQTPPPSDNQSIQQGEAGKANFGSGQRDVTVTTPTASSQTDQSVQTDDVADTPIAERTIADASSGEKGKLRQAAELIRSAAGEFFSGKLQKARDGLSALKSNPKETVVSGAKSLKQRTITLGGKIKARMPSRPKGVNLPPIKSLFSRAAKSVPPTPSVSVKEGLEKIAETRAQGATQVDSTRGALQDVRREQDNVKTLNKLLDDPTSFFKAGPDVTVNWNDQSITISGDGLERAQSVKAAVSLAVANRTEIRETLQDSKDLVDGLRASKKEQKAEVRGEVKSQRSALAEQESVAYQKEREGLQTKRNSLKATLQQAKQTLKKAQAQEKGSVSDQRKGIKTELKAEQSVLQGLKKAVKAERSAIKDQLQTLQKDLDTHKSDISKYEAKLKKTTGHAHAAAESGLAAAREEANGIALQIAELKEGVERKVADTLTEITTLETSMAAKKTQLDGIKKNQQAYQQEQQAVDEAQRALDENTRQLKALRDQHQLDRKAIRKS